MKSIQVLSLAVGRNPHQNLRACNRLHNQVIILLLESAFLQALAIWQLLHVLRHFRHLEEPNSGSALYQMFDFR